MTGSRLASGGRIDRSRVLHFTFDGSSFTGHPGDTVASALLANGVRVVGRSFKYHRPRGVWGAWFDDPNAIFNITLNGLSRPNCQGATTPLEDGMEVRAVNAWPSAKRDIKGGLDLLHRFLSAGFYYKMFMWPDWHLFEPSIRKMAGLGQLDGDVPEGWRSDQRHDGCDLLVVGAGPAGLAAATAAAEAGADVVLVDDHPEAGGSAWAMGDKAEDLVTGLLSRFDAAGGRFWPGTTAFGIYDHQMVGLCRDRGFASAPDLVRLRARRCIMATGAMDRPVTFAMNDRPGVMSLGAATEYAGRYGVKVGECLAVLAHHAGADAQAEKLSTRGLEVTRVPSDAKSPEAVGRPEVTALKTADQRFDCDTILTSAGLMPVVHLWRHAGGKLDWDKDAAAFVPASGPGWMAAVGAAGGIFDVEDAIIQAEAVALEKEAPPGRKPWWANPPAPEVSAKKRQWIDFQHDVTLKDIALAARENYRSVEHLKRYTTLGMASDQGKTSNVAGLSAMAALTNRSVAEVGTTTFRPPFVPVPLELYRGAHREQQFHPVKRLLLEDRHREAGAALGEYGGWLRPAWYGNGEGDHSVRSEALMARRTGGIFDASPLGKIEVMGPGAADFVNFIYYNTINTMKPGHIRYGFMLTEGGAIHDDGVIARMGENRFVISCSSSHVDAVNAALETWRQDGHDPDRIFVHDTTQNWSTITVTGPKARDTVDTLGLGVDISADSFAHMQWRAATFQGNDVRIARVSFTGDVSFEISCPASSAHALWDAMLGAGRPLGVGPMGLEALSILRAEKGYLIVGKDTDGETMPHDIGFAGPRLKKTVAFVGDRGLHTDRANSGARRQLVGLRVPDGAAKLPTGGHVVTDDGKGRRSCGYVTSSYDSPHLGRPIALALLEAPVAQDGTVVDVFHLGQTISATVVPTCQFDPGGERLNA